jgi:hypothetical protein
VRAFGPPPVRSSVEPVHRNRFAATRLTPAQAHEVWERSDEATAFTRPDYLAQLVDEVDWWGVERSGEVVAAWPLVRAVAGGETGPPPFCYYVGPMFARELQEAKFHRYWAHHTAIFATLIDAVAEHATGFRFSLPPGLTDVRPLEWWNFDNPDKAGFHITPRHTARVNLADAPDEESILESFARIKRRAVKHWSATPATVVDDVPEQCVVDLHDRALSRNGQTSDVNRHVALRRMIRLITSGAGSIIGLTVDGSAIVDAVILMLDGSQESNDILCVASDDGRETGLTTWATWQGILRAREMGMRWFDFNGANSPRRAADKHFYGARTELYFDCQFGDCRR